MKKKILICLACLLSVVLCLCKLYDINNNTADIIGQVQNTVIDEIKAIDEDVIVEDVTENEESTTEVMEDVTLEDEQELEYQETENEAFEIQGEIAYEGDRARSWGVELGEYKGLTYYSQIDPRWKNIMYSSTNNASQTIGSSACGPTSAAMVVSSIKGTITPDTMSALFVKYGYRSANNGTYWSAYRAVADEFNIGYTETSDIQKAIELLRNNHYVICSVGNGLFTTGGHYIVLVGIDGDTLKIFDPYLYNGKFNTSTRRGKVEVSGNTVYCSVSNFKAYANYKQFFCYENDKVSNDAQNSSNVVNYIRYVNTSSKNLNVRNVPSGKVIGSLTRGTKVTVYEQNGSWSKIGDGRWVSSIYLASSTITNTINTSSKKYMTGSYKVTSNLHVRSRAGTNYKAKVSSQLTANARKQNARLGGNYNGYRKGVVCTVTRINDNWGLTASGWICLTYCTKQ